MMVVHLCICLYDFAKVMSEGYIDKHDIYAFYFRLY